jgi:hypothetical protein
MRQETVPFPRNGPSFISLILIVEDDHSNAQLFLDILSSKNDAHLQQK